MKAEIFAIFLSLRAATLRGNPVDIPEALRNCHVAAFGRPLAMTHIFGGLR